MKHFILLLHKVIVWENQEVLVDKSNVKEAAKEEHFDTLSRIVREGNREEQDLPDLTRNLDFEPGTLSIFQVQINCFASYPHSLEASDKLEQVLELFTSISIFKYLCQAHLTA